MVPPAWALLERDLLKYNSLAVDEFAKKFMDERGYLAHTPRWGTLDGPDDAIETYWNWTLLHALGASAQTFRRSTGAELEVVNQLPDLKLAPEQETQVLSLIHI